jgi:hypothetical protein
MKKTWTSKAGFLITALVAGLLAGCASYRPAEITGDTIRNSSVGFKGYSVSIPPGYKAGETEKVGKEVPGWMDADVAMHNADLRKKNAVLFRETFFIYNPKIAIYVGVTVEDLKGRAFSSLNEVQASHLLMDHFRTVLKDGSEVKSEVIAERNRLALREKVRWNTKDKLVSYRYLVLGDTAELYAIHGFAQPQDQAEMEAVVTQVYRSLKF